MLKLYKIIDNKIKLIDRGLQGEVKKYIKHGYIVMSDDMKTTIDKLLNSKKSDSMKDLIIAYSSGYENGHRDTVDGFFYGDGTSEIHDSDAVEWIEKALDNGAFNRELEI